MSHNNYIIDTELSEFMESDVAMLLASSNSSNQPVISRGFGARVSDDCSQITVYVTDIQAKVLIDNIQDNRHIALNGARVTNYESYQLKGTDARLCELNIKDKRHIDQYCIGLVKELKKVGVPEQQARALFQSMEEGKLMGIKFTVSEVYCQTPGAGAGEARKSSA